MKKFITLLAVTALLPFCALAETLSPKEALQRASRSNIARAASKATKSMDLVYTQNTVSETPAVYVFQAPKAGGYMFVAADDVAVPVLGYTDSGSFDAENMAPGLKAWLQDYAREIQYAVTMGNVPSKYDVEVVGTAVAPLMKTKWNQGDPYNLKTPEVQGVHCVTGCVATAMAQVMKYWEYPEVGKGSVTARVNNKQTEPLDLSTIKFDWKNMTYEYNDKSTDAQKNAVADLMVACGYSVDMGYTANESGAQSINLVSALVNNFGYNKNIQFLDRNFYSGSEWNRIVYEEVKAGRPVLYAGSSLTGAHQYVVDGYNADGYFHLNWGWGGMSDGYFSLNALNPGSQGIGGSAGGYNYGQSIIQGVQIKATPDDAVNKIEMVISAGGIVGSANGLLLDINPTVSSWLKNGSSENLLGCMAIIVEGVTDSSYLYQMGNFWCFTDETQPLQPNYGWDSWSFSGIQFPEAAPDGKYKVTLGFKKYPEDTYSKVTAPGANYFYVTKTGSSLEVENVGAMDKVTVKSEVSTKMYDGCLNKLKFTIKNEGDHEVTKGVYPALYDEMGNMVYDAEGFMLTLQPGEEFTQEFTTEFMLLKGQTGLGSETSKAYKFKYFDPISWQAYSESAVDVTLNAVTGNILVACTTPQFVGLTQMTITNSDGSTSLTGYKVPDPSNIKIKCTTRNMGTAYFAHPISMAVCEYNAQYITRYSVSPDAVICEPNKSCTIETTLNYPGYSPGVLYQVAPVFIINNDWLWPEIAQTNRYAYFTVDTSGIMNIYGEDESAVSISYDKGASMVTVSSDVKINSVNVYGVGGAALGVSPVYDGNSATVSVADLQAGVYIVTAKDAQGRTKALKIVK